MNDNIRQIYYDLLFIQQKHIISDSEMELILNGIDNESDIDGENIKHPQNRKSLRDAVNEINFMVAKNATTLEQLHKIWQVAGVANNMGQKPSPNPQNPPNMNQI
jgi:hypothetical protein